MKILSTLLASLRQDCNGFIVSTELMLLGSIVFFGLIAAFAATRDAVISELSDVAGFSQDFNQSFSYNCLLYTSPSPRDQRGSRMPSSA